MIHSGGKDSISSRSMTQVVSEEV